MTANPVTPAVRDLAQWLFEHEAAITKTLEAKPLGFCRICDMFRVPLTSLAGSAGYKSLLSRALTLAKQEHH
jgi:hypothetical protein